MGRAAKSARAARLKAQLPELEVHLSEARKRKDSDSADSDRMSQRSSAAERSRSCEEELEAVKLQEECKTELPRRMGGASVALPELSVAAVLQLCCYALHFSQAEGEGEILGGLTLRELFRKRA